MSDPLLIALFALVGSTLGGFASPLVLRLLDRRYAREDRTLDAADKRATLLRDALQELSDTLVDWNLYTAQYVDNGDFNRRVIGVHQKVQLLIGKEDGSVGEALSSRMAAIMEADGTARSSLIGQLNSALVVWYRGGDPGNVRKLLEGPETQ